MPDTPTKESTAAMMVQAGVIGEMKGTLAALVATIAAQSVTAAETRKEQKEAAAKTDAVIAGHIAQCAENTKEVAKRTQILTDLVAWRNDDAEPTLDALTAVRNKIAGGTAVLLLVCSALSAGVAFAVDKLWK